MKITRFTCENLTQNIVTDNAQPCFSFSVESDEIGATVAAAEITVNGEVLRAEKQIAVPYQGKPLQPFTEYEATLTVTGGNGERATKSLRFETGRMSILFSGEWITDGSYRFTAKKTSPTPMLFQKTFACEKKVRRARLYATALGIYDVYLNGKRVNEAYFAPGFTSYPHTLQYQTYDVTPFLEAKNSLETLVSGGWAVGAFVMTRKNRITAPRQALLMEMRIEYEDGSEAVFGTDESFSVTRDGNLRFAEFYDGEVYDATVTKEQMRFIPATRERVKIRPTLTADYGAPVLAHEVFQPISVTVTKKGALIYDFGQNFAGVVRFKINGKAGQTIVIRHAEILTGEGELNTAFLRSAKCQIVYTCKEGAQTYSPRMTYMGFRYISVEGVAQDDFEVEAVALYSNVSAGGSFECSDERLNKLQSNIVWSAKSNFVDIPTDCPQRDERMGWTGDIALFAPTACFNFDMRRFLEKWLQDVRSEQTRGGGIPNTVPAQGYGFPATMPKKAVAFWGDACVFVTWAHYLAYGDKGVLQKNYEMMKRYVKACTFWAKLFSFGKNRYIWNDLPAMQFGDWVAPDLAKMSEWQARCKWTGTAAIARSSEILSKIAQILGKDEDAAYYEDLRKKTADAYVSVLTDGNGKLKTEFQTAYVLPLHFAMFPDGQRENAAKNLARLVESNGYKIGTGFPGTPYLLFALADNGYAETAFQMLMNEECPSWLYEVRVGATTVWERYDALDENGACAQGDDGTGGMVSFNHYAFGAVGDFLYRRIAGVEALDGGYKKFRVAPLLGGGLTYAKATVDTPYGEILSAWRIENGEFSLQVKVPVGTACEVVLPSGESRSLSSGCYEFKERL